MKVVVCVKQVPDTETKVKVSADQKSFDESSVKWILNPYDEYAVEEVVKLKEKNPQISTVAITLGPKKRAGEVLRTALAMGIDEGVLIDQEGPLSPLQVAQALAGAISLEGDASIVFCGKASIDANQSATPQMVAQMLNFSHATVVSKFEWSPEVLQVHRDIEGGSKEVLSLKGPVVLSTTKGLNNPRYASLPGIMKAKKKTLKELSASQFIGGTSQEMVVSSFQLPPEKSPAQMINGDTSQQVRDLVRLLRDEAKVL